MVRLLFHKIRILRGCLFLVLLLIHVIGFTQQEPQSSLYMFNPQYFNPAYAGSRGTIHLVAHHRSQWVGIQGAPMTQYFSFSMPLAKQNIGIGLHATNDMIGVRRNTGVFADFAYALKLNRFNHRLAFAITGGADLYQVDYSGLPVQDPNDPNYGLGSFFRAMPNFGLGIMYYGKNHFVGFSIPRLLSFSLNHQTGWGGPSAIIRHYYLVGGYNFNVGPEWQIKPSAIIQLTENAPPTFTLNPSAVWIKKLWMGLLWRYNESLGFNLGLYLWEKLHIAYAFDFPYNDLRYNNYGSHEILIGIDIGKRKKRPSDCSFF